MTSNDDVPICRHHVSHLSVDRHQNFPDEVNTQCAEVQRVKPCNAIMGMAAFSHSSMMCLKCLLFLTGLWSG